MADRKLGRATPAKFTRQTDTGLVQVSIFLFADDIERADQVAAKRRCTRSQVLRDEIHKAMLATKE